MTRKRTYGGRAMCPVCGVRVAVGVTLKIWWHRNRRGVACLDGTGQKVLAEEVKEPKQWYQATDKEISEALYNQTKEIHP